VDEVAADGVDGFPLEEGGGDGGGEAAAVFVILGVDEDIAVFGAAMVFCAEADAEGVFELGGGVEGVLAFEDGAADAGETAGDAVDVAVGWSGMAIGREVFEDGFAVRGIAGELPEIPVTEGLPLALVGGGLFVEGDGKVFADEGEVGVASGANDDGVSELGSG